MTDLEKIRLLSGYITPERFTKMKRASQLRTRMITIVMEDIYQPHNAAAVLRTCDAFGIQDVYSIQNRYLLSISGEVDMGTSKWLDVFSYIAPCARRPKRGEGMKKSGVSEAECAENTRRALSEIRGKGYILAASTLRECDCSLADLPLDKPLALMLGTELTGLSAEAESMADMRFSYPMCGFAQSFNLSVFAAICLADLCKRMRSSGNSWRLSKSDSESLLLKWLKKSVSGWERIISEAEGGEPRS